MDMQIIRNESHRIDDNEAITKTVSWPKRESVTICWAELSTAWLVTGCPLALSLLD